MSASPLQSALRALVQVLESADSNPEWRPTLLRHGERLLSLGMPDSFRETVEAVVARLEAEEGKSGLPGDAVSQGLDRLCPLVESVDRLLASPLTVFSGVGPKRATQLERRGLATVEDILFHLPTNYRDRRALIKVDEMEVGQGATFLGEVMKVTRTRSRQRFGRGLEVLVEDETGRAVLKWFRFSEGLEAMLAEGAKVCVSGEVGRHRFNKQLVHPEIEVLHSATEMGPGDEGRFEKFRRVMPVYPAIEGVSARLLQRLVASALDQYVDVVPQHFPRSEDRYGDLPSVPEALRSIHAPPFDAEIDSYIEGVSRAHRCLALEELYLLELGLALRKSRESARPGVAIPSEVLDPASAAEGLPFALTGAQERSLGEIFNDLGRPRPMNRLLQGDVGSGKTVVAYLAARAVAAAGHQAALMVPTELLAEQHWRSLRRMDAGRRGGGTLRIALLSSSLPRVHADAVRESLREGHIDLVVGTHALVQEGVVFDSLALAVVDEQHRFGVLQRAALAGRGGGALIPHGLVMTATPIPRTLSLTLYGDLDVSVIDELPPGRTPVESALVRSEEASAVLGAVVQTLERGEQVYVVYPLVEKSEKLDLRNAKESAEKLARALPDSRVDLVHGRLDAEERAAAMARFEAGETGVLVATSVIEVGVDVPNATLMVVEHAERFGLAQLHQLRGRVGRGHRPGRCLFVSRGGGEGSEARLAALLQTADGFRIAEADLRIRGPGEFLGTRQHGAFPDLRVAHLLRDSRLVSAAREAAFAIVGDDPELEGQPALREAVESHWGGRLRLADVA